MRDQISASQRLLNGAHFVAEEAARDVNLFASYNNNLLPRQNLLGDDGCQPAKQVAFTVNDDWAGGEGRHAGIYNE